MGVTNNTKDLDVVRGITFENGSDRVNGYYELDDKKLNKKLCWRKTKGVEDDPILCYFWPGSEKENTMGKDLWMISRESRKNTQSAYACCESAVDTPVEITSKWKVWSQTAQKFEEAKLHISQTKT